MVHKLAKHSDSSNFDYSYRECFINRNFIKSQGWFVVAGPETLVYEHKGITGKTLKQICKNIDKLLRG